MRKRSLILLLLLIFVMNFSSCKVLLLILNFDQIPNTQNLPIISIHENVEKTVTLPYVDFDGHLASSCEVIDLVGVVVTTACSCDPEGRCTVGLTASFVGTATLGYFVTANNLISNISYGTLQVINSAPVANDLTPPVEYQLIEKIYTLSYSDIEGDLATTCTISNLNNVVESSSCLCDGSGVCRVGITANSAATYLGASFDYTVTTNGVVSNTANLTLSINQIGAAINDEWIKVPSNAGGMGLDEFYVMKFEARAWTDLNTDNVIDDTGAGGEVDDNGCLEVACTTPNWGLSNLPVSIPINQPWRLIDAQNAALRCQSLGANYQLISNDHWMAMARDIENQAQNWTGDFIGGGGGNCLFRGNTGELTVGDGSNLGDSCGYNATPDPDSGIIRDLRSIHTLSNGAQIYDLAGNLPEWTDWDKDTIDFQLGPTTCLDNGWEELSVVACGGFLTDEDYLPTIGTYDSNDGVGKFYGGIGGAALRGGVWAADLNAGLFTLRLSYDQTFTDNGTGFRCVFVP